MEIQVDSEQVRTALLQAPVRIRTALNTWVQRWSLQSEREAKLYLGSHVSAGATGQTMSSIHTLTGDGGLMATVKPTAKYAYWVHEGRKPGRFPPYADGTPLSQWAKRMGMNPFLVARGIAKHGTKGIPFMKEAFDKVSPLAKADSDNVIADAIRSL